MPPVRFVSLACVLGLLGLVALFVASSLEMSLGAGLRETTDTRWGVTTLVDLYLGLLLILGWIAWRERSLPRTAAWAVALALTGNFAALIYLLLASLRAETLGDLFTPRSPPPAAPPALHGV